MFFTPNNNDNPAQFQGLRAGFVPIQYKTGCPQMTKMNKMKNQTQQMLNKPFQKKLHVDMVVCGLCHVGQQRIMLVKAVSLEIEGFVSNCPKFATNTNFLWSFDSDFV